MVVIIHTLNTYLSLEGLGAIPRGSQLNLVYFNDLCTPMSFPKPSRECFRLKRIYVIITLNYDKLSDMNNMSTPSQRDCFWRPFQQEREV